MKLSMSPWMISLKSMARVCFRCNEKYEECRCDLLEILDMDQLDTIDFIDTEEEKEEKEIIDFLIRNRL